MIRQLAFATLVLMSTFAMNVQAAQCDDPESEACHGGGYCDVQEDSEAVCPQADGAEPSYGGCDGEVCAYGEEDCIWCSAPIDEEAGTSSDAKESKGIPALGVLFGCVALLGAALIARK